MQPAITSPLQVNHLVFSSPKRDSAGKSYADGGMLRHSKAAVGISAIPNPGAYDMVFKAWAPLSMAAGLVWSAATVTHVLAGEWATKEEAQAMDKKAVAMIKEQGPDKAYPAIISKTGGFTDR